MLTCKSLSWTCEFASFSSYILVLVLAPVQELTLPLVIIFCFPFFPITSHWGQDAPPLFLSSWLLKIADPLPCVLVWVSFLRIDWGRTFLQTEHMVPGVTEMLCLQWVSAAGKGCLCLCRSPLSPRDCWYLMSSFTEMLLFLMPLVHFLGERAWGFENILALVRLLRMVLEFIRGSCLQQLWSQLLPEKDFCCFLPFYIYEWVFW